MKKILLRIYLVFTLLFTFGCKIPKFAERNKNIVIPISKVSNTVSDTVNVIEWRKFFQDSNLVALIDTALIHNQELNIFLQELEIRKNEISARKGEYLPFFRVGSIKGLEKNSRYTRFGALDNQLDILPGKKIPEYLNDNNLLLNGNWEIDIWNKLRNAKKSAVMKFMATQEGKNFLVTNLVSEIANSYYELMSLDNLLEIVKLNIQIQKEALDAVKQQKESAKLTQLAVNRFEAQLLNTQNLQYEIKQQIVETENRINFLVGKYSDSVNRNSSIFLDLNTMEFDEQMPVWLLFKRPDVKQAEYELNASKLDVKSARAAFLPSLNIGWNLGFQAFNPSYLINPNALMLNLAGELMAPLINRKSIMASYKNASANQIKAVFNYDQVLLNAYTDIINQFNKVKNFSSSYEIKKKEVEILKQSVTIANNLFNSARADYAEVLLTQREALDSKIDLVETKRNLLFAKISVYRAMGGGWK